MAGTLKLTREAFGIELRRGTFEISVDGKSAGSIEHQQAIEMPLEAGPHTLRLRKGRYSSREQAFTMADGDVVSFRCHGAEVWPRYVASIIKPDLAISLTRE
jgi:hypothetical protein